MLSFVDPVEMEILFSKFLYRLQEAHCHKVSKTTHSAKLLKFVVNIL